MSTPDRQSSTPDATTPLDVFCDGAVRLGDWSAAAQVVSPTQWTALAWRATNAFLAEARAVTLALDAHSDPLAIHSDCGSLVRVLTTPATPNRRKPGRLNHRLSDRMAEMATLRSALEGRCVTFTQVPGHSAATPHLHRIADTLCRYALVRLAGTNTSPDAELSLDYADIAAHHDASDPSVNALARAMAIRLRELGIYDEDRGDSGPLLDWRSGGFEIDAFGVTAHQRRVHRLEHAISWALREGDPHRAAAIAKELEAMAAPVTSASPV